MKIECNKLDSYLADDLPADDQAAFDSPSARLRRVSQYDRPAAVGRWLVMLVHSIAIEAVPSRLTVTFRSSLAQRRRSVRLATCGLAAAALLILAAGWTAFHQRQSSKPTVSVAQALPPQVQHTPSPKVQTATFVSNGDAIAIPLESPAADVTVVQVYPTIETQQRWQRDVVLQTIQTNSKGG